MEDLKREIETLKVNMNIQSMVYRKAIVMLASSSSFEKEGVDNLFNAVDSALHKELESAEGQKALMLKNALNSNKEDHQEILKKLEDLGDKKEPLPTRYDEGVEAGLRAILLAIIMSHPNKEEVIELLRLGSNKHQSELLFDNKENERFQLGLSQTLELLLSALDRQEGNQP